MRVALHLSQQKRLQRQRCHRGIYEKIRKKLDQEKEDEYKYEEESIRKGEKEGTFSKVSIIFEG